MECTELRTEPRRYTADERSDETLGRLLLQLARNAIAQRLEGIRMAIPDAPELRVPAATFVTLTRDGQLRGCIGSLEASRPLAEDVAENAVAAAFRDPRFAPLAADELADLRVEVSRLTPPEPLPCTNEEEALAALRPGEDGLVFEEGARRATFLPQVWEALPQPREFLGRLKEKAGFDATYWSPRVRLYRYRVRKWKED